MTKEDLDKVGKGLEPPKPGTYQAKVVQAEPTAPKDKTPRIEVIYEITKGDSAGFRLYDYLVDGEASKWKRDQFWVAAGLVTGSGKSLKVADLDPAKVHKLPEVLLRVSNRTWNDEIQADIKGVYPLEADSDDADAAEESDDSEGDDGEEIDLDAMSLKELKAFAEDNEIEIPATKKTTGAIRSFIASQLEEPEEEEAADDDGEDEAAEDEEGEEVDLSELSLKELRILAEENDIDHDGMKRAALEEALEEALGGEEEGDAVDGEEAEEIDYSDWSLGDLKEELKERGIKAVGSKSALVAKLEKSDKTGGV